MLAEAGPGLPPQVRGALVVFSASNDGKRAYPRRCGEHITELGLRRDIDGLPPQVRGALLAKLGRREGRGLTPAGAGSTVTWDIRSTAT